MTEIEQLILEVQSKGLKEVNDRLDVLESKTEKATAGWSKFKAGVVAVGAAAVATAVAIGGILAKLTQATKTYQSFNAQLTVATKSGKGAAEAYEALLDFATETPYATEQAIGGFIKLVNLGLTPSERALKSYGNTATSMGKELSDMIEAVADAATGEFERLKEFGIKSSKEGDKVTFTFQGVKTEIANNAAAIEEFLIKLGENQFAGAMTKQMATLGGAMSNLEDGWAALWTNLARQGPDTIITQAFREAVDVVDEFNTQIVSGELEARVLAYATLWADTMADVKDSFSAATTFVINSTSLWTKSGDEAAADFADTFKYLPVYAKGAVDSMANRFNWFKDEVKAVAQGIVRNFKIEWERLDTLTSVAASRMKGYFKGDFTSMGIGQQMANVNKVFDAKKAAAEAAYKKESKLAEDLFKMQDDLVGDQVNQRKEAYDAQVAEADRLRLEYEQAAEARKKATGDRLAKFRVGGDPAAEEGGSATDAKAAKAEAKRAQQVAERALEERLQTVEAGFTAENQVISDAYEERKTLILDNEKLTLQEKQALTLLALSESIITEEENIRQSYERRMQIVLESTQLTEEAKTALMTQMTEAREQALAAIEKANMDKRLDAASTFFGNIASIGSTFGKEGFEIAKAAAIAQATIKTYEAATSAYASLAGIPYVGPALGAAAAAAAVVAGVANVAQIKAQTYQGAYAHGGMISAGKYGLVGEAGPELVRGPAIVTSASTTASHSQSQGIRTVTVHNNGQPVEASSRMQGDELILMLQPLLAKTKEDTKKELANEISKGGGRVSKKMEETYGLRRGAQ